MDSPVSRILADKDGAIESVAASTLVADAVARMNARNIGSVVVLDGDRPIGIFTERDVLTRVVGRGADPTTLRVGEVMTHTIITIRPDTTVREAMMIVTDTRCRHLPVLVDGAVTGMISIGDLTRWVVRAQQRTIDDLTDYICRAG